MISSFSELLFAHSIARDETRALIGSRNFFLRGILRTDFTFRTWNRLLGREISLSTDTNSVALSTKTRARSGESSGAKLTPPLLRRCPVCKLRKMAASQAEFFFHPGRDYQKKPFR